MYHNCKNIDSGSGWDELLVVKLAKQWPTLRQQLRELAKICIIRWFTNEADTIYEIHAFCDASESAYGAVIPSSRN